MYYYHECMVTGACLDGTPSLVPLIQSLISQATEDHHCLNQKGVANTAFGNGG